MSSLDRNVTPENIEDGFRVLDSVRPGWYRNIDLTRLNQAAATGCVLGQTFGLYDTGMSALGHPDVGGLDHEWAAVHGFNNPGHNVEATLLWTVAITARLNAEGPESEGVDDVFEMTVNDVDFFAEVLRKHVQDALRIGSDGTYGNYTDAGIVYNIMSDLGFHN
jgi:hypothetical protein